MSPTISVRAERSLSREAAIKAWDYVKDRCTYAKAYFQEQSGGKTIVPLKKIAVPAVAAVFLTALVLAWIGPKDDHTFYRIKSGPQGSTAQDSSSRPAVSSQMATLFGNGQRQKEADSKKAAEEKKKKVSIRYYASQVLGTGSKGPKAIKSGSKLIGVLLSPIDTRAPSLVRVQIPTGGESGGVVIEPNSTLVGQFSYSGNDDKVYLTFARIDSPDGDSKQIHAQALNASDYTPGVPGDHFTGGGVKIAASMGLTMFSGMTDTLTDRESIGNNMFNGVQARPSMKNALLQGVSQASQQQASRTASSIDQEKDYVVIPQGKEMIIELSEDFTNGRNK